MRGYLKTTLLVALPTFLLGMAVAMWALQGAPTVNADSTADGIAGVWIGTNGAGEHFVQTIASDPEGHRITFNGASVNVSYGTGIREGEAGTQGEAERIAPNTYAFRAIDWGVVEDPAGGPDQIATIILFEDGITEFDPENGTAESHATVSVFGASSDGDGDGLPDPGAEPLFPPSEASFWLKRLGI